MEGLGEVGESGFLRVFLYNEDGIRNGDEWYTAFEGWKEGRERDTYQV